tara:strand:+ start:1800 stop:2171 length:372 start_codon:yes stop_codon:yes gene_type:complete
METLRRLHPDGPISVNRDQNANRVIGILASRIEHNDVAGEPDPVLSLHVDIARGITVTQRTIRDRFRRCIGDNVGDGRCSGGRPKDVCFGGTELRINREIATPKSARRARTWMEMWRGNARCA